MTEISRLETKFNVIFDGGWPQTDLLQFTCLETNGTFCVKHFDELPEKVRELRKRFGKDTPQKIR